MGFILKKINNFRICKNGSVVMRQCSSDRGPRVPRTHIRQPATACNSSSKHCTHMCKTKLIYIHTYMHIYIVNIKIFKQD